MRIPDKHTLDVIVNKSCYYVVNPVSQQVVIPKSYSWQLFDWVEEQDKLELPLQFIESENIGE